MLGQVGIQADVRIKLRKAQARTEARAAAKSGYPLVIAAGGDGTVGAVARGLVGTRAALGIVPLGTYNNVATSLGIPRDVPAACALIASGTPRPVDVAQAEVRGRKKPRVFLETATVGLGAALTPVGQDVEKGRWDQAAESLPLALDMRPTTALVQLDKAPAGQVAYTLLVTVANAPRAGAGLRLAPDARMDDGLLDVAVYHDMDQAALALRAQALKNGTVAQDERVRTARGRRVEVRTSHPMPVSADSKLIGVTPARFRVLTGALLAVTGQGDGLLRPGSSSLASFSAVAGRALAAQAGPTADQSRDSTLAETPAPQSPVTASIQALVPVVGRAMDGLGGARAAATPAFGAAAGAFALALVQRLIRR
jgi:diacylglycerol kinase (ATP)